MSSMMEFLLPPEEQVSDHFSLFYIRDTYYAVRAPSEGDVTINVSGKHKWEVVAEAVDILHKYIVSHPDDKPRPIWDNESKKVKWE